MPNRILKESICESRGLSEVSFFAEDLYKRLITYADDYGRFNADFQIILARLYPRELRIVTIDDIEDAITELIGVGKIEFYTSKVKKEIYGCFPNWGDHQRIRESKKKMPDPDDTEVNDWYLRRYVPQALKIKILNRDNFKCKQCGKYICTTPISAERLIKMGAGLYHIDHIVPVVQGGRATEENLRLLCPKCNLSRKKHFTFEEIVAENIDSPQTAATCGESQRDADRIQSESKYRIQNPNPTIYCTEQSNDSSMPVYGLSLNDGSIYEITQGQYEQWMNLYPAVDVMQELRNMQGWLEGNPKKKKTRNGILRFITGWLSRSQDKPHMNRNDKQSSFNWQEYAKQLEEEERLSAEIRGGETSGTA